MKHSTPLSGKDIAALGLIGAVIILSLGALSAIPITQAVIAILIYGLGLYLYLRLTADTDMASNGHNRAIEPHRAAYIGEARLADGLSEAVLIIGRGERISYANPAARELLGVSQTGMPLATMIRDPAITDMVKTVIDGNTVTPVDYHIDTPVDRYFRTHAVPMKTNFADETARRVLLIFYDVTHIVHANNLRSDFLANASHELKTPVASLLGYIETLRGHAKDDPKAREKFLAIMQSQAERMQRLIEDLLSLRRIELTEHIAPTEATDLVLACRTAMESVQPLAKGQNIKLVYDGPDRAPVQGFQDDLVQLVLNLIHNAVHASTAKTTIRLQIDTLPAAKASYPFATVNPPDDVMRRRIVTPAEAPAGYIMLRVKDQGPGFAREHLPRIGERFYRVSETHETKGTGRKGTDRKGTGHKGTGLGLAIVKHIVLRHRGGLFIETVSDAAESETGTEFILLLPVVDNSNKLKNLNQ